MIDILPDLGRGGDWQTVRPNGLTEIIARITAGEAVPPDSYYMRTQPRFTVAGDDYEWMRRHLFVGRSIRNPDNVIIDFYLVD